MGLSTPSIIWDKTASTATSEASVSKMHGVPGMGKANVVASKKASFNWRKARSPSSVHLKGVLFFFVNRVSGLAMVAKLRTKRR